ncbi:hypothetical protein GCM10022221_36280 [Actinocorallia aurea]
MEPMARVESFDDPNAPAPNSLVVAASAAVVDGEVRQQFDVRVTARVVGGVLRISAESTDLRFVSRRSTGCRRPAKSA